MADYAGAIEMPREPSEDGEEDKSDGFSTPVRPIRVKAAKSPRKRSVAPKRRPILQKGRSVLPRKMKLC
jgi:hypothetical protein